MFFTFGLGLKLQLSLHLPLAGCLLQLTLTTLSNLMGCSMPIFHAISFVHSKFQAIPFFRKGMFFKFEEHLQTVQILMRRLVTSQHIWICTVCKCSLYRSVVLTVPIKATRHFNMAKLVNNRLIWLPDASQICVISM